jgi:ketosteroid isomerase-like protein
MKIAVAVTLALMFCASGAQADTGVEAAIQKFGEAFNKGDVKAAKALHVAKPVIIDELAPYLWSGSGAFDGWLADLGKSEKAEGKTEGTVTISAPSREVVAGDHAYVIAPATYSYKQKGKSWRETAQITFVLTKVAAAWKIAAWTWTGPDGVPVK